MFCISYFCFLGSDLLKFIITTGCDQNSPLAMVTHESQSKINKKMRHAFDYYNMYGKSVWEQRDIRHSPFYFELQQDKPWRTINKIATKIKNFIGVGSSIDIKNMLLFGVHGGTEQFMYLTSKKYNTVFSGKLAPLTSKVFGNHRVVQLLSTYFNFREYSCFKRAIIPKYENSLQGDKYIFFWEDMMQIYQLGRILNTRGKIFMWITAVELDYVRLREYIQLNLPTRQIMMNLQDVQGWWPNQNLIEWAREHVTLQAL